MNNEQNERNTIEHEGGVVTDNSETVTEKNDEQARLERKKRLEASKRRKSRRRKKRVKSMLLFLVILGVAVFIVLNLCSTYPFRKEFKDTICRDFTYKTSVLPELPSEERLVAWDSELPNIIQRDLKKAKEEGCTVDYTIGNSILHIYFNDEGEPMLEASSSYSWVLNSLDTFENFSIYKKGDDLYVYGYENQYLNCFTEQIFYSDYSKHPSYETLTYDINMPLNHETKGIRTLEFNTCSLYYDEDTQTFSFYSKGKEISSKTFFDTVEEISLYNGIIITKNHMLYRIFTYVKDGLPDLKFVYVADGLELSESTRSYYDTAYLTPTDRESSTLVIFKGEDGYYTTTPNNWEDYDKYSLSSDALNNYDREADYSISLVNLKDAFVSARFKYSYSEWEVLISFNINGKIYTTDEYTFYGYDTRINLSDQDAEKLSVKVNSIDEIETQVQNILDAYASYY